MPYGTLKVDTITFTANGIDTNVSISGLTQNPSITGNLTVTGTISGNTITGAAGNFTDIKAGTSISGAVITGGTAGFTTVTGTTVTGTTANFVTLSGTTVTGTTVNAVSGVFTTQVSGNLYKASGNVTVISGSGDVRPYGLYSFPTTTGVSGYLLTTNSDGTSTWQAKVRSVSAAATSGTLTPDSRTTDLFVASGLAGAITMAIPAGTPENGQRLLLRFKDNGTARAITWTTSLSGYRAIGITLPTTTVISKTTYVGCVYNSADTYWDAVATVTEV